jgi:excisionase family DNA binding protein
MKTVEPVTPRLLTTAQAAVYLNLAPRTVRQLWYARKLQAISTLKHLRFDVRDLDKWIETAKDLSR